MKKSMGRFAALSVSAIVAATSTQAEEQRFLAIGTAGVTGIYYAAGGGICRLVNKDRDQHGIRCSVESTGGSVYNLRTMRAGQMEVGIVQSDWQYHAYHGTDVFAKDGPNEDLRAIFSLHPDTVIIAAREEENIRTLEDLKGKTVNLGNIGSGIRATADVMFGALDWDYDEFGMVTDLKSAEQSAALCDGKIDAFLMVAGNPVANVLEAASTCEINLVPVKGEAIDALVDSRSYYGHATIAGGLYPNVDEDVETFGLSGTFVATAQTPDDVVYTLVKTVFENFDKFKRLHPSFANLEKQRMVQAGLTAPLHPGAARYYREAGLLPADSEVKTH